MHLKLSYTSKVFLLILFILSLSDDLAAATLEFSMKSDTEIAGYSPASSVLFEAKYLKGDIIEIKLQFNGKKVSIQSGYSNKKELHLSSSGLEDSDIIIFTAADSEAIDLLLSELLAENWQDEQNHALLTDRLISSINFLDSWPINQPVQLVINDVYVFSMIGTHAGEVRTRAEFDAEGIRLKKEFGQFGPDVDMESSADPINICDDINLHHDGWYPYSYFTDIVGPYPFQSGGCFGRCGKGCVGDGGYPFQNSVNRFTQDCFNHDGCVDIYGYDDSFCTEYLAAHCWDDFFYAPECFPDCSDMVKSMAPPDDYFGINDLSELEKAYLSLSSSPGIDMNGDGRFSYADVISAILCYNCRWDWQGCWGSAGASNAVDQDITTSNLTTLNVSELINPANLVKYNPISPPLQSTDPSYTNSTSAANTLQTTTHPFYVVDPSWCYFDCSGGYCSVAVPFGVYGASTDPSRQINGLALRFSNLSTFAYYCEIVPWLEGWTINTSEMTNGIFKTVHVDNNIPLTHNEDDLLYIVCDLWYGLGLEDVHIWVDPEATVVGNNNLYYLPVHSIPPSMPWLPLLLMDK